MKNYAALLSCYSWSKFGREAEFLVAIYLKSCGWDVQLSRGSRGPADLIATQGSNKWLIQVKSSSNIPRLKGQELKQLRKMAKSVDGHPVIATVQHKTPSSIKERIITDRSNTESTTYGIFIYSLVDWKIIYPEDILS
jgi:Holliday junction resolvase